MKSKVGGGTLPLLELDGWGVALPPRTIPGVIGRIEDGRLILDPRTVLSDELDQLARRGTAMPDS